MAKTQGISFLYQFDVGNKYVDNPAQQIQFVTSTAPGDFDVANITSESTRERWRSAEVLTWQEIIIKADLKSNLDTIAILGHNFTENAVIQLQANIANNFAAPPVTVNIPWRKDNLVWLNELGAEYEYYRLRILDPTNPCGFVEFGRFIGGRAFTFSNNEDIRDQFSIGKQDFADKMKTEGFFRQSNQRVKVRTLSASFAKLETKQGLNIANFEGLRTMFDIVGTTVPLLTVLDRGNPDLFTAWGQFDQIPAESFTTNEFMTSNFKFAEVF